VLIARICRGKRRAAAASAIEGIPDAVSCERVV
jgi:hypothetical protein